MKRLSLPYADGPSTWLDMPARYDSASQDVRLRSDTVALMLDRAGTSPNVVVGVEFGGLENHPLYLAPGDIIPVPGAGASARFFNPMKDMLRGGFGSLLSGAEYLVGYVRIIELTESEVALYQGGGTPMARGLSPRLVARLSIAAGSGARSIVIPTWNLSALRLSLVPFTAAGTLGFGVDAALIPADLALSVDPFLVVPGMDLREVAIPAPFFDEVEIGRYVEGELTPRGPFAYDAANGDDFGPTRTLIELSVPVPGIAGFRLGSLTAAGADNAYLTVEGV